jgi:hypothetical protein
MKVNMWLVEASAAILIGVFCLGQHPTPATSAKSAGVQSSPRPTQVQGYESIRLNLPSQTAVPVRLPTFIPPYADKENPIYAIVDSASSTDYKVQLAWARNCQGGNWCHLGEIAGSVVPFTSKGRRAYVALGFGVNGFFVDFTCGAHCNDAVIYWREGSYYYSIAMKAGKKQTLLKMAHSAILEARARHS